MAFVPDTALPVRLRPSPCHNERRSNAPVDMVILHYTGMKTGEAALARLTDPASEVSAHYVVDEDGTITQCVPEARRAWHAGASFWKGERDVNSRSIGIEIVNPGHDLGYPPFPDAQIEAVIALLKDVCGRRGVAPERILGHSDVAPARKIDPGEKFPWNRLAAAGVGHFVPPVPASGGRYMQRGDEGRPVEALQSLLALYGYDVGVTGVYDQGTFDAVTAFQRHSRTEKIDGIADMSTIATLHALLSALPGLT